MFKVDSTLPSNYDMLAINHVTWDIVIPPQSGLGAGDILNLKNMANKFKEAPA